LPKNGIEVIYKSQPMVVCPVSCMRAGN